MVGDEDAYVAVLEPPHYVLNVLHGNRIDTGKGFVEHNEARIDGKAACYLGATAFAARQLVAEVLAELVQSEVVDEFFEFVELLLVGEIGHFKHRHDVVLHAHLAEHARLLRQVAYAGACPFIDGIVGYFAVVEVDVAGIGYDETRGHIERCGFSGTVGTEQPHDFALLHIYRHVVHDGTLAVSFHQALCAQHHAVLFVPAVNVLCITHIGCKVMLFSAYAQLSYMVFSTFHATLT